MAKGKDGLYISPNALGELEQEFNKWSKTVDEESRQIVEQTGNELKESFAKNNPVRTRKSADGWRAYMQGDNMVIRNMHFPPRTIWLEFGTRTRLGTGQRIRGRRRRTRAFNFVRPLFNNAQATLWLRLRRNFK